MKYCLPFFIWFISSLATLDAFGQIDISYPSSRAIFQRDRNNNAVIYIAGKYTKSVDRIEAKFTAMNGGENINWTPIQSNPQGGFYFGNLTVKGGWYELQVRGMKGDQQIGINTLSPVGVGEVFMIAGQSNAQGFQNDNFDYGSQRASDDRVNCVRYNNDRSPIIDLPYPEFAHIESDAQIAPRGLSAWSWGKLGDLLASKLGVPILFYNAAWEGTLVRSWRESITGTAHSPYIDATYDPSGMPYTNMKSVLQNYVSITGIRSVLWIQGEADNQFNTPTDEYASDLKAVIDASRNDLGKNIPWMVALTSYINRDGIDNKTLEGQKKVINTVANIFTGPSTDGIQIPRTDPDGVHFHHEGLTRMAEAWNGQINDDFLSRSEPIAALSPLQVVASCAGNNVNLVANNVGYTSIIWNSGQNSNSIQVGNGSYRATARNARGNIVYSPTIQVTEPIQPTQPTISLEGSNPVCLGNTATLVANTNENITWNNGSTSNRLSVTTGGDYFVTTKNIYGCEASSSRIAVSVLNSPLPETPVITASGPLTFCDGGEVSLQSNSKVTNIWSTGARTGSISVRNSGEFRVQALDNVGCYSVVSNPVTVKVNSLPAKPLVSLNGPSNFCAGGNVLLTSSYDNGNTWSNAAVSKTITVGASGIYSLKQTDSNGCVATSDPVTITVNALPATPVITSLRPTTFCLRDFTTLRSSEAYSYIWSNGSNNRQIDVRTAGNFSIAARDQNGCTSPASAVVTVVVNPLPATPVITADGPTVFCADLSVNLQSTTAAGFLWSNGSATQTLKVATTGTYSVQTINEFRCYSDPSNRITTQTLALPPSPIISALGLTTFCDGDFVVLQAIRGNTFIWNTGVQKDTIHVSESGAYSARVKDLQGCFSPYSPQIVVDVKVTPSAPVINKTGVYTLTAENNINAGDHIWRLNGTILEENSTTIKAVQSGSYDVNNSVIYSPTLTCFSEFSAPFAFIADPTNNGMVAYPNPLIGGPLTIETLQNITNATVQVIDSRGIIHKTFNVSKFDSQQVFNLSDLSSGLYFIRILSVSFNASQKVIIVK